MGKGGKTFLEKSFSLPSPNPIPPFPKTFDFIESLLPAFPVGMESVGGALWGAVFPVERECAASLADYLGCPPSSRFYWRYGQQGIGVSR